MTSMNTFSENESFVSEDIDFYPHSVTLSKGGVKAHEAYSSLKDSLFSIYLLIISLSPDKNYSLFLSIFDINKKVPSTQRIFKFDSLDSIEYQQFMKSYFCIFEDFPRHILNFEKNKSMKFSELEKYLESWSKSIIN